MKKHRKIIFVKDIKEAFNLFGSNDENLVIIENEFPVKIIARGERVIIEGERNNVEDVLTVFENMKKTIERKGNLEKEDILNIIHKLKGLSSHKEEISYENGIPVPSRKKIVVPKTPTQRKYVEAIRKYDIVFAIGPAGTGKTYVAMAMAISSLKSNEVQRIILVRPAVEAGEKLGYLPGTFQEKVDPYLRPLYDALYDMMEVDKFRILIERGIIEVAPLAYMRGRTLNDAFIILDEAQNTTIEQMKMFLTRLGFDSKAVITGDITQIDLPENKLSGLVHVQKILSSIKGIEFVYFDEKDVVRHELVQEIIKAYAISENNNGRNSNKI